MQHDSLTVAGAAGPVRTFHWPATASAAAPALVLIHGMLGDAGFWAPTIAALDEAGTQRPRAIAVELRGHGGSEPPVDGDYSPAGCAADVARVLDAFGLERAVIVGHSYGSLVALAFAAAHPERVARLVLADPPGDLTTLPPKVRREELEPFLAAIEGDGWREAMRRGFDEACEGGRDATRQVIFDRLAAAPRERTAALFRPMFEFPAKATLERYLARGRGGAHAILAPSNAWPYSLHVLCPALTHTVLPNVGHWLLLDDPERFSGALLDAAG
jgi:pimeloyl-ACP methyl ester carboxylesterase